MPPDAVAPNGPMWWHEVKHDGYRLMVAANALRHPAIQAARFLQQRLPASKVVITDLRDGSAGPFQVQRKR